MSKRSSRNSIKFGGKPWDKRSVKVKRGSKVKPGNRRLSSISPVLTDKFNQLCKLFNPTKPLKPFSHHRLLMQFKEVHNYCTGQRIDQFKKYTQKTGRSFNIQTFFDGKYYKINFKKQFPEVFSQVTQSSSVQLIDFVSEEKQAKILSSFLNNNKSSTTNESMNLESLTDDPPII